MEDEEEERRRAGRGTSSSGAVVLHEAKITVPPLPSTIEGYGTWRLGVCSSILAATPKPRLMRLYLAEMDTFAYKDLNAPLTEQIGHIDNRLYDALLKAAKNAPSPKYAESIEALAMFGCGRQALRVLDGAHNFTAKKVGTRAQRSIIRRTCGTIKELEEHISSFRLRTKQLAMGSRSSSPYLRRGTFGRRRTLSSCWIASRRRR